MTFVMSRMNIYSILLLFCTTDAGPAQLYDSAISLQANKESTRLTIGECDAKWSSWNDRDNPSATGDWELIHLREDYSNLCAAPEAAQARIVGTGETHTTQNIEFGVNGLVCKNADQQGELCLDYEVRFCCPGT